MNIKSPTIEVELLCGGEGGTLNLGLLTALNGYFDGFRLVTHRATHRLNLALKSC